MAEYQELIKCIVRIYYHQFEEAELLMNLLSYGPILEIEGPIKFKKKFKEKLKMQWDLLHVTKEKPGG